MKKTNTKPPSPYGNEGLHGRDLSDISQTNTLSVLVIAVPVFIILSVFLIVPVFLIVVPIAIVITLVVPQIPVPVHITIIVHHVSPFCITDVIIRIGRGTLFRENIIKH